MNEVIKCILERRSIRKFSSKEINREDLDLILKAGEYAPSAGGRQDVLFLVIQNKDIIDKLGKINRNLFTDKFQTNFNTVSKTQPSIADDENLKNGFYDAPVVISILGSNKSAYFNNNSSIAGQNIMLAAESLGLASCMVGRAHDTFQSEYGKNLLRNLNIDESFSPVCHIALGYPDTEIPKAKPRKDGRIIFMK
ncbi:nitroreductase family protein [Cetobacterium sp.]|uniref:nitroreductase family protein n=1 Tax=Cetobacterium sp. TaxID=2071632 RepID=UPI003F2E6917